VAVSEVDALRSVLSRARVAVRAGPPSALRDLIDDAGELLGPTGVGITVTDAEGRLRLAAAPNASIADLERAIDARALVDQATGMVAVAHGVGVDAARERLRRHAFEHCTTVRRAHPVVHSGCDSTPGRVARRRRPCAAGT
jgi:hypothetical protein